jgi:hypothetical protein
MAEEFLQEQLNRMRAMSEQMSEARSRVEMLCEELSRNSRQTRHPLADVRDFRIEQPYDPLDSPRQADRARVPPRRRRR